VKKRNDHYMIKRTRNGYVVINTKTGNHTHVRSSYGAGCLMVFVREGIDPDSDYLRESMRRIQDPQPIEKKHNRQRYKR